MLGHVPCEAGYWAYPYLWSKFPYPEREREESEDIMIHFAAVRGWMVRLTVLQSGKIPAEVSRTRSRYLPGIAPGRFRLKDSLMGQTHRLWPIM